MKTLLQLIIEAYEPKHYEQLKDHINPKNGYCSAINTDAEKYHKTKGITVHWNAKAIHKHLWRPKALTDELIRNNGWLDTKDLAIPEKPVENDPQYFEVAEKNGSYHSIHMCYNRRSYLYVKDFPLYKPINLTPPPIYLP